MSLVDDTCRGSFTANKEIVSLIGGMVFSFIMGAVLDGFVTAGKIKTAFTISASVIFLLTVVHSLSLILTVEKMYNNTERISIIQNLKAIAKNKKVLKVTLILVIYYTAHYTSVPFYGTYMIKELDMSLKTVAILSILGSITRIAVSRFWGKYADKRSFAVMLEKCFVFLAAAFICVSAATPKTGLVMLILYHALNGVAMGGINSAMINLVFDYAPYEIRSDALAISQAAAGAAGFLATLCISPLISFIQSNGNSLFGISIYAQQFVSIISLIIIIALIVYVRAVLIKNTK